MPPSLTEFRQLAENMQILIFAKNRNQTDVRP